MTIEGNECVKEMVQRLYPEVSLKAIELVTTEVFKYINEYIEEHNDDIEKEVTKVILKVDGEHIATGQIYKDENFFKSLKEALEKRGDNAKKLNNDTDWLMNL